MLKRLILTIIFLLSISALAFAQTGYDDQGNPNDPAVNPDANACFEGGAMEGKCNLDSNGDGEVSQAEIDWAWTCGWYLIRIDHTSEDDRATFPASCVSLLKALYIPVPEEIVEATPAFPTANCIEVWPSQSVDFGGGNYLATGGTLWLSSDCTGSTGLFWPNFAYAPGGLADAIDICIANGHTGATQTLAWLNNTYDCTG